MSVTFEEQEKNNPKIEQETVCDAKHILSMHLKYRPVECQPTLEKMEGRGR